MTLCSDCGAKAVYELYLVVSDPGPGRGRLSVRTRVYRCAEHAAPLSALDFAAAQVRHHVSATGHFWGTSEF